MITPDLVARAPLKVGMSGNLFNRMKKYDQVYPFGFKIHAIARTAASRGTQGIITRKAERYMLDKLGKPIKLYKSEWFDPAAKNRVLNVFNETQNLFSGNTHLWDQTWTASDIKHPDKISKPPTTYIPERRLRFKQPPKLLPPNEPPKPTVRFSEKKEPRMNIQPDPRSTSGLSERELRRGIISRPRRTERVSYVDQL